MPAPIDWIARWNALVTERDAQTARWRGNRPADSSFWDKASERFAELTKTLPANEPFLAKVRGAVTADDVVLDVGAGAGRFAVAIAPYVKKVIALDPSPGMLNALKMVIMERGIGNIEPVNARWPEGLAQVGGADVVICSHAFYWETAIEPYLRALDAAARRAAFVYIRVHQNDAHISELYPRLRGETRSPEPTALDFVGALTAIGVWPDVTMAPGYQRSYASMDELIANTAQSLCLDPDDVPRDFLEDYLRRVTVARDGRVWIDGPWSLAAIISWRKAQAAAS